MVRHSTMPRGRASIRANVRRAGMSWRLTRPRQARYTHRQLRHGWRRPHARMQRPPTGKPVTALSGSPALSRNCGDEPLAV